MAHLVEVSFRGNRKEFFLWDYPDPPPMKAAIIVDADRGEDLGYVFSLGDLAQKRNGGCSHGCGTSGTERKALRLASQRDRAGAAELERQKEEGGKKGMERVRANGLSMKVSDAEWQWDKKKLTFYFTAEKRVDFRNVVCDLASLFRTRSELKQIGVRDEARRLNGIGRCGRQYCSASWLAELRPVNLGVAKDQRLSLNPSQIAGACGRLMCCLRYEHEFYVTTRRRFPKEGKSLRTSKGEEKVIANDLFRERVTLRSEEGESRVVTLDELRAELDALGIPFPAPGPAPAKRITEEEDAIDDDAEPSLVVTELVASAEPEEGAPPIQTDRAERIEQTMSAMPTPPREPKPDSEHRRGRRRGRRGGRRGRTVGHATTPPSTGSSSPPPSPTNCVGRFYLTTAIDYPNRDPHLRHALE